MPRKPASDKKNFLKKSKKHVPSDDDDSSVDSKGNVRNLIDYDYDEDDEEEYDSDISDSTYTDSSYVPKKKEKPPQRKAAVKAARRIRRLVEPDDEESVKPKHASRKIEVKKRDKKVSNKEMKRNLIVEDTSDSDSSLEDAKPKVLRKGLKSNPKKPRVRKEETETEESAETSDTDSDSSDDEEDEDLEDEEQDEEEIEDEKANRAQRIGLMISSFGAAADPKQPKKHKMKDQPPIVKKFVKLVQKEGDNEENAHTIDTDISYFKGLSEGKQNLIIEKMERKFSIDEAQVPLKFKILENQVPQQVE
jgi:hypothetical protein